MSDEFPPMIGKYKVIGIIAKGGMGVVYKAIHPSLKRYVVIKKMTARGNSTNAERFKKEAQILLDLQSPYIVHLFDYFTEGGYRYMVEELVDGMAIDKLLKKQQVLPPQIAMLLLRDACYALKYAHSKNIVHRDIKPGNILISKRSEIKLADFGIASDANDGEITKDGVALGTPSYMPPEQYENSAGVDRRADIYALGIMLYEMVTGTKPYPGTFSKETLAIIKKGKYIQAQKIDKSIPKTICGLIRKMIKPKAKNRFQNIDSVLNIVNRYLNHYDIHEIRQQLAKSVLTEKQYKYPEFIQKDKIQILIKKICCISILFFILIFISLKTGLIHRYLLKKWYSPVSVEMVMPKSLSSSLDLPVLSFFFENDNDKIPEVKGSSRTFSVKGSRFYEKIFSFSKKETTRPTSINETYNMKDVFLKNGNYRVKVVVGPYIWWKSFSVNNAPLCIECDFLKNMKRTLKIRPKAYDSETGEDITTKSIFEINYNNSWIPLENIPPEDLTSASVWKIKIKCDGYHEENFSLLINWYQDELFISSDLKSTDLK
jgi:eukaryotic-like serine/threonine-protein kinase